MDDAIFTGVDGKLLTLEADSLQIVKWLVNASYAIHPDMKSHTGVAMSLERGSHMALPLNRN